MYTHACAYVCTHTPTPTPTPAQPRTLSTHTLLFIPFFLSRFNIHKYLYLPSLSQNFSFSSLFFFLYHALGFRVVGSPASSSLGLGILRSKGKETTNQLIIVEKANTIIHSTVIFFLSLYISISLSLPPSLSLHIHFLHLFQRANFLQGISSACLSRTRYPRPSRPARPSWTHITSRPT